MAVWDTVAFLALGGKKHRFSAVSDQHACSRKDALRQLPGDQHVLLSWSGLVWCLQGDRTSPVYLSQEIRRRLCVMVLGCMARPPPVSGPLVTQATRFPASFSPFGEQGHRQSAAHLRVQQVAAWLVRCDTRLALPLGGIYDVSIPSRVQGYPQEPDILLQLCTYTCCHAQKGVARARAVVVCACWTQLAPIWQVVRAGVDWVVYADQGYATLEQLEGV